MIDLIKMRGIDNVDAHRKQFESIMTESGPLSSTNGIYNRPEIHILFLGFMAGKEFNSIKLPDDDGSIAQNAYKLEVSAFLKSQGYSVEENE